MKSASKCRYACAILLTGALVGGALLTLSTAIAGPPAGKGKDNDQSVPSGRIHIGTAEVDANGDSVTVGHSLLADASDLLPSRTGHPSHLLHAGHRWFLERVNICLEKDAEGNCVKMTQEVLAVRELDGFEVQLTDDPTLLGAWSARWNRSDSSIGFIGVRSGVESIYVAGVSFDADGLPFLTSTPAIIVSGGPPVDVDGITFVTDIDGFDFSPDGTRVVWARHIREQGFQRTSDPKDLMVTDLLATEDATTLLTPGVQPEWSPDGASIAFGWNHESGARGGIALIAPDGSGYQELSVDSSKVLYDEHPTWSPDSQHVAFKRFYVSSNKGGRTNFANDVMRVPAAGGSLVNLTEDLPDATVYGWR